MIARSWRGATAASDADRYLDYLRETGVRDCRATPGNRGVYVLRRIEGERAVFLFISLWESMESVEAFAGPDPERGVFYPEDERWLAEWDRRVEHFEVVEDGKPSAEADR